MNNKITFQKRLMMALLLLSLIGCIPSSQTVNNPLPSQTENSPLSPKYNLTSPMEKKLVAVAGFENRSTFSADKLWDTCSRILATEIVKMGYFKVVEWERMKQLFDWDTLSISSLVKSPNKRSDAANVLLCEYFITGVVTYFDVSQKSQVSALSKKKVIDTSIRVDLLLQDASTGEYLSAATGEATESQIFKGGLTGGQTGTWSPKSADNALSKAIETALYQLTVQYDRQSKSE